MKKFFELWEQNVVVSGALAVIVVVTFCIMAATGKPIPQTLIDIVMLVCGFFFGHAGSAVAANKAKAKRGE